MLRYVIFGFLSNLRAIIGPLPEILCRALLIFNIFNVILCCLISLSISVTKYTFICCFKTIPVMDDSLLSLIICFTMSMYSILLALIKVILQKQQNAMAVKPKKIQNNTEKIHFHFLVYPQWK